MQSKPVQEEKRKKPTKGMSIYQLRLPETKIKNPDGSYSKVISAEVRSLAKNRIELFVQEHKLKGMEGSPVANGFNVTLPDKLVSEFLSYVKISGASINKLGLNRHQRRAMEKLTRKANVSKDSYDFLKELVNKEVESHE